MDIIDTFFQSNPAVFFIAYTSLFLVSWYGILALDYSLNSGQLGRGRWWVFECLWEDILWNIPGGTKRKANELRRSVDSWGGDGSLITPKRAWTYAELRQTGDYEACALAMYGGPFGVWFGHALKLALAILVGPAAICTIAIGPCDWRPDLSVPPSSRTRFYAPMNEDESRSTLLIPTLTAGMFF